MWCSACVQDKNIVVQALHEMLALRDGMFSGSSQDMDSLTDFLGLNSSVFPPLCLVSTQAAFRQGVVVLGFPKEYPQSRSKRNSKIPTKKPALFKKDRQIIRKKKKRVEISLW